MDKRHLAAIIDVTLCLCFQDDMEGGKAFSRTLRKLDTQEEVLDAIYQLVQERHFGLPTPKRYEHHIRNLRTVHGRLPPEKAEWYAASGKNLERIEYVEDLGNICAAINEFRGDGFPSYLRVEMELASYRGGGVEPALRKHVQEITGRECAEASEMVDALGGELLRRLEFVEPSEKLDELADLLCVNP